MLPASVHIDRCHFLAGYSLRQATLPIFLHLWIALGAGQIELLRRAAARPKYTGWVMKVSSKTLRLVLACTCFFLLPAAGQVAVHYSEGLVHGFLVLRSLEGETLAHGDLIQ